MDNKKKLIIGGGILLLLILLFTVTPLKNVFIGGGKVDTLIKQAKDYFDLGELDRALDKLDKAEQENPSQEQQKKIDKLRKKIVKAKQGGLDTEGPVRRLIRKAKQDAQDKDYETAIKKLGEAKKINENKENPDKDDREEINKLLKQYKEQMRKQALKDDPNDLLRRARAAVREGDFETALKLVRRARRAYKAQNLKDKKLDRRIKDSNRIYRARQRRQAKTDNPRELINRAKNSASRGDFNNAFKYLRRARRANNAKRNPNPNIEKEIKRLEKEFNKREREQIIRDNPRKLVERAKKRAAEDDFETAINLLKRARRANNAKDEPDKNLAKEIERLLKKYKEQMRKQALRDNPEQLVKKAQGKAATGDYDEAIKLLRRARRANLARRRPSKRLTRKILRLENEYKRRQARKAAGDNPHNLVNRAKRAARSGDYDNALKLLRRARRANNIRNNPDRNLKKEIARLEQEYKEKRNKQAENDDPHEIVKRAKKSARNNDYETALNLLNRAERANNRRSSPDKKLASEIETLRKAYTRALLRQARNDNPEKLIKRAKELSDNGDYNNALKLLRRARRANNLRRKPSARTESRISALEREIMSKMEGVGLGNGGRSAGSGKNSTDKRDNIDNRKRGGGLSNKELEKILEQERKRLAELRKKNNETGPSKAEKEKKAADFVKQGDAALKRGEKDKAIELYKKALEHDPENAKANAGLGYAYLKKGNNQNAFKFSTRAISTDPNNSRANLTRGEIFYKNKQDNEAEAAYKKALVRDKNNALALYRLGVIKLIQRKNRTARGYFTRASNSLDFKNLSMNDRYKCYYNLGKSNERIKSYSNAVAAYKKSIQYDKSNEKPYISMGQIYYNQRKYNSAISNFKQSLEFKKTYYAHFWMGKCYDAMKDYNNAVSQYNEALQARPENYEARYNLARVQTKLGRYDTAVKHYKEAGEKHGFNSKLLVQLGNAYLGQNKHKEAQDAYKKAIAKNSREVEAYKGLAKSLIATNDNTGAIVYLKEGANLSKDSSIYAKLGELYFKIRDYDQAISAFRKALDRSPKNTNYRRLVADVYFAKSDYKTASQEYEKVISLNPRMWVAYHRLGDSYIEMKMFEAAKTIYKKLIDRNPNYGKIGVIREKLNSLEGGS